MKVRIDREACVGNARCAAIAPGVYRLDDVGFIALDEVEVPTPQEALARRGALACPERIITVVEDPSG